MNPLDALIQALSAAAGPRGSTFAGRVIPQGAQPTAKEALAQLPTESPDAEGMGTALANALKGVGTGATLAHVPGTFRKIGLERVQGTPGAGRGPLNPGEYLARLQQEPNYPRFQELIQALTKRNLGPEFQVFRGAPVTDELMLQPLTKGTLPAATAGSLKPEVARDFATWMGFAKPDTATQVARITATPESVVGLLPRRGAKYASEAELIIDPRRALDIALQGGIQPKPFSVSAPDKGLEQLLLDALTRGRTP